MSYVTELRSYSNNVKQEIDDFWTNILSEFDAFSTDISNRLDKIERDYNENRQKYGLSDNHHFGHRSSQEYHHQIKIKNVNHNLNQNVNKNKNKNNHRKKNNDNDIDNDINHYSKQQQYKKFVQNGNNTSINKHNRSLSTMEIPSSFKLDPLSFKN